MDKYDEAIERLTKRVAKWEKRGRRGDSPIVYAWGNVSQDKDGCLFQYATPTGRLESVPGGGALGPTCGCLTQIRNHEDDDPYLAWTDALTEEIAADERIPDNGEDVKVADLPVFAEWQRRLDKEIRS